MALGFISVMPRSSSASLQRTWKDRTAALLRAFLLVFLHAFLQSFEALTYRSQGQQGDSHRIRQF
jgi:hypothetical protein